MIITLIIGFITILLFVIDAILRHKNGGDYYSPYSEGELVLGISKFLGLIVLIGLLLSILIVNFPLVVDSDRIKYQEKYKTITATIDEIENDNIILLTSEISEYNITVIKQKRLHKNPWVSWFFNSACDDLPLIEIEKEIK